MAAPVPGDACSRAAEVVGEAEVLFVCTGAGFSADSGLPVYQDIANIPAYHAQNLGYRDLCDPHVLDSDPSLFYGFWGTCLNDYRNTQPHRGYDVLSKWKGERFQQSEVAQTIRRRLAVQAASSGDLEVSQLEPYSCEGHAGAFFVFTSNVDAHSLDHFNACEIRECHGSIELWQCSSPCVSRIWRAPPDLSFCVDVHTMAAAENADAQREDVPQQGPAGKAHVGCFREGKRTHFLSGLPPYEKPEIAEVWQHNRPACQRCHRLARPAILMFDDDKWIDNRAQEERYNAWCRAVEFEARLRLEEASQALNVCILEIGCGKNVPTVQWNSQKAARLWGRAGAQCTLIRVNPEAPETDSIAKSGLYRLLAIPERGLHCLEKMDVALMLKKLLQES